MAISQVHTKNCSHFQDFSRTTLDFPLNSPSTIIYILSWTTKKHKKTLSRPLHSKLKKIHRLAQKFNDFSRKNGIQGLFKDFPKKFKDFSRLREPCQYIRVYKTIFTLYWIAFALPRKS